MGYELRAMAARLLEKSYDLVGPLRGPCYINHRPISVAPPFRVLLLNPQPAAPSPRRLPRRRLPSPNRPSAIREPRPALVFPQYSNGARTNLHNTALRGVSFLHSELRRSPLVNATHCCISGSVMLPETPLTHPALDHSPSRLRCRFFHSGFLRLSLSSYYIGLPAHSLKISLRALLLMTLRSHFGSKLL